MDFSIGELQKLLTQRGVPWVAEHPSITKKCIGLCCSWCSDDSFHLGVFKDFGNWTCWRCGRSGPLWQLTKQLFGMGREELERVLDIGPLADDRTALEQIHHIFGEGVKDMDDRKTDLLPDVILPPSQPIKPDQVPRLVEQFLSRRRFTVEHCVKYDARYASTTAGRWACRLILPIRMDGYLVGCQGRSLGQEEPRYLNLKGVSLKNLGALYGADNWQGGRLILVEGPLDVWRLGDEACATFGANMTTAQKERVWTMQPKELLIAWDAGTYWSAFQLGRELAALLRSVKVLRLPAGGDPDDLGLEGIEEIAFTTSVL